MIDVLEELMHNPYVWAVLALIGITSLVYEIICQQKNKEKKEFSYWQRSLSLIAKKNAIIKKLSVSYDGRIIEDLSVTKYIIWNSGNKTINSGDMVDSKELTIFAFGDHIILDTSLIVQSEPTNRFSINLINKQTVKITFDYVEKNDGIVIQIIHTGNIDDLRIDCKIKGGYPIKKSVQNKPDFVDKHQTLFFASLLVLSTLATLLMIYLAVSNTIAIFNPSVRGFLYQTTNSVLSEQQEAILQSIFASFFSVVAIKSIVYRVRRVFRVGIPKQLKEYADQTYNDQLP